MPCFLRLSLSALLCLVTAPVLAQQAYMPIEQRLSAEQMRATGLDQLSADQRALLNRILGEEHVDQAKAVREQLEREDGKDGLIRRDRAPILTRLSGEFQGWTTGTHFRLENGQTWRVIGTPSYYVPRSRASTGPAVIITPGLLSGSYLQVEGHSPRAKVQPVN
ncbi:hypothetical protein BH23PSE2_BH23PSE2_10950 [soil metagenome]